MVFLRKTKIANYGQVYTLKNNAFFFFSRFASSKSGKIYLHTDVRMIIFRKSDLDTAADFTSSKGFELRSFTQGPSNPKFSPRR